MDGKKERRRREGEARDDAYRARQETRASSTLSQRAFGLASSFRWYGYLDLVLYLTCLLQSRTVLYVQRSTVHSAVPIVFMENQA